MPPKFVLPLLVMACAAALAGLSCSGVRPPARAVPEAKMVDLYAGILVIQEEGRIRGADSVTVIARTDSVCASYGVTRGQMQSELEYYRADLPGWKEFNEKVIGRLEELQREDRTARK